MNVNELLDIEGMEAPALRGAKELISKNKPLIYIESQLIKNFNTNADILEALGYIHFFMWDMGAPTHLFRHLDSINERQLAQKFARDSAILRLHSRFPQGIILCNGAVLYILMQMVPGKKSLQAVCITHRARS